MEDMIKIKLTKVSERSDAEVPNNIQEGEYRIGYVHKYNIKPLVGKSYVIPQVEQINDESVSPIFHYFYTSQVIEILYNVWNMNEPPSDWAGCTFKTLNSIYKVELL
jgi:hypothetical protein